MLPLPIQFLLFMLALWMSRHQKNAIGCLKAEIAALRELFVTKIRPTRFVTDS